MTRLTPISDGSTTRGLALSPHDTKPNSAVPDTIHKGVNVHTQNASYGDIQLQRIHSFSMYAPMTTTILKADEMKCLRSRCGSLTIEAESCKPESCLCSQCFAFVRVNS